MPRFLFLYFLLFALLIAACKKKPDPVGDTTDPRLDKPYCNVPEAVNYNWDFPGTADSSVCFYPSDVFVGNYRFVDTIYYPDYTLAAVDTLNLQVTAATRSRLLIAGFCDGNQTLKLVANRNLRATLDTVVGLGQTLCRPLDTVSGYISRLLTDTAGHVNFYFTVVADTSVTLHQGTAVKMP